MMTDIRAEKPLIYGRENPAPTTDQ